MHERSSLPVFTEHVRRNEKAMVEFVKTGENLSDGATVGVLCEKSAVK